MKWDDTYSVHIDEIDEQHKILLDAISALEISLLEPEKKKRWSTIHYAIIQLIDYTRTHFVVEEALMRIMRYPQLDAHITEHREFEKRIHELEKHSLIQDVTEHEIVDYLRNWLVNHICVVDHHYGEYFRAVVKISAP